MDVNQDLGTADLDGDGVMETQYADANLDGQIDTIFTVEPETGYSVAQTVAEDGSRVSLVYDPYGVIYAAEFVSADGAVFQLSGDEVTSFLDDLGAYTGEEVPLTYPEGDPNLVTQVPIDESTLYTVDDVTETTDYQDWSQSVTQVPVDAELEQTPVEATPAASPVIGDTTDADFWFQQNTRFTCGPASATQIIEDFTGVDFGNEATLANYAAERGWLTESGMVPANLAQLLTDFGVPSTVEVNQSWDQLAGYLREGRSVVMFVDAFDYWPGQDVQDQVENSDQDTVNHFIRIVGIDTERQVAILADPGHPNGYQMEVPLATLEEAWNDVTGADPATGMPTRDRMLVVSQESDPTAPVADLAGAQDAPELRDAAQVAPVEPAASPMAPLDQLEGAAPLSTPVDTDSGGQGLFSNPRGFAIVPVTLAAGRIFYALSKK